MVLSALDEEERKVAALDLGADDFVTKPFGVPEFMARMRAALRHRVRIQGGTPVYDDGRLHIDLVRRIVRMNVADPRLTPLEYAVLREMVTHAGKVLTHRHLKARAWEGHEEGDTQGAAGACPASAPEDRGGTGHAPADRDGAGGGVPVFVEGVRGGTRARSVLDARPRGKVAGLAFQAGKRKVRTKQTMPGAAVHVPYPRRASVHTGTIVPRTGRGGDWHRRAAAFE